MYALLVVVYISGAAVGGAGGAASVGPFVPPAAATFSGPNAQGLCAAAVAAIKATQIYLAHPALMNPICVQTQ